jgi:peptidoglycan/LPS O-acetylase OafA/YrhL
MMSGDFGHAVLGFIVGFVVALFVDRQRAWRQRLGTGFVLGAIAGGAQLARVLFPSVSEPPISTILSAVITGGFAILLLIGVRAVLTDRGQRP